MNEKDKEYKRFLAACFAMNGLISRTVSGFDADELAKDSYQIADSMLEAEDPKETIGLPAIKRKAKAK